MRGSCFFVSNYVFSKEFLSRTWRFSEGKWLCLQNSVQTKMRGCVRLSQRDKVCCAIIQLPK